LRWTWITDIVEKFSGFGWVCLDTEGTERAERGTEVGEGRPAMCLVSVFLWLHFLILKSEW